MKTPSAQILVFKYHSPIKEIRAPWRSVWFQGWDRKKIQEDSGVSYGPEARKCLRAEDILKATGADPEELSMTNARTMAKLEQLKSKINKSNIRL